VTQQQSLAVVAISCLLSQRGEGDVPVVVCPSDHLIKNTKAFCDDVIKAAAASNDY
jgi:mannose-1-phosphate guanylyltransferase